MVLETLAKQILGLVDWGITILALMIVWEFIQLLKLSGGGVAGGVWGAGKGLFKAVGSVPRRLARRAHKAEINQFITEEKEEEYLDRLKSWAVHIVTELEAVASQRKISQSQKNALVNAIDQFGGKLNEARRYFRDLSRATNRDSRRLEKMFNYFKEKKIAVTDDVKKLEQHIIVLHAETADELAKVEEMYQAIVESENMKWLKSIPPEAFGGGWFPLVARSDVAFSLDKLYQLIKVFKQQEFLLEDAYSKQAEAKKEMTGIIQETRPLYEQ
ncbi:hypothetical protein HYV87_02875 [Candidatus Woesearchaeota archaeon]|nr:hypothetical protein [Candidatus Woesearchaeota archaeon]